MRAVATAKGALAVRRVPEGMYRTQILFSGYTSKIAFGKSATNPYENYAKPSNVSKKVGFNVPIGDPLARWMYFFRSAQGSTPRELLKRLTDPIFGEALEILQMVQLSSQQIL